MMKVFSVILAVLTSFSALSWGDEPVIKAAQPREGVYFTYTGHMTTVLELKRGHFRYWFDSDAKGPDEPLYPLTGDYSISGDGITLKHPQVFQTHWTFRSIDGEISLWRDDAIHDFKFGEYLTMIKKYGAGSILVKTDQTADEVWKHRGAPVLTK